ncbi:MAG: hypothetical protein V1855_02220 [bacterium]
MYLNFIKSNANIKETINESIYSKEAIERADKIKSFDSLRAEGSCEKTILEAGQNKTSLVPLFWAIKKQAQACL